MGKLVTQLFAETIIKAIDAKFLFVHGSIGVPDKFKQSWFEWVHFEYEAKESDCTLDVDGFWKLNKPNHNNQRVKFFWRIEPNYCTGGRPLYLDEDIKKFYKNSETRKSILKLEKSEICLEWDGFDSPTETCWGLRMKPIYVTIYENGKRIYTGISGRGRKKHLIDFCNEYYKWERDYKWDK
jgi:hypothetical protein